MASEGRPQNEADSGLSTTISTVRPSSLRLIPSDPASSSLRSGWTLEIPADSEDARNLAQAARELRETDVPVAFPTETVYGLGANATSSKAVKAIFIAKQRPADNPLIVHVHCVAQLRDLMKPSTKQHDVPFSIGKSPGPRPSSTRSSTSNSLLHDQDDQDDPIPSVYRPLIERFWPGPLTVIMPNASDTALAPEVTAGLQTFGVRMPQNSVALALLKLADVPLAAPSANASTKPSPTTAQHVLNDLYGRISTIIDGGPSNVGLESTVVDGLSHPPLILRPGGISKEEIQACVGWETVEIAYKDHAGSEVIPRAPGMKYKHYSPRAAVVLYEVGVMAPKINKIIMDSKTNTRIGIIRTFSWPFAFGLSADSITQLSRDIFNDTPISHFAVNDKTVYHSSEQFADHRAQSSPEFWDVALGRDVTKVAQSLFAALRELDLRGIDAIHIEGVDSSRGDVAAAIMNRLRKAAGNLEIDGEGSKGGKELR